MLTSSITIDSEIKPNLPEIIVIIKTTSKIIFVDMKTKTVLHQIEGSNVMCPRYSLDRQIVGLHTTSDDFIFVTNNDFASYEIKKLHKRSIMALDHIHIIFCQQDNISDSGTILLECYDYRSSKKLWYTYYDSDMSAFKIADKIYVILSKNNVEYVDIRFPLNGKLLEQVKLSSAPLKYKFVGCLLAPNAEFVVLLYHNYVIKCSMLRLLNLNTNIIDKEFIIENIFICKSFSADSKKIVMINNFNLARPKETTVIILDRISGEMTKFYSDCPRDIKFSFDGSSLILLTKKNISILDCGTMKCRFKSENSENSENIIGFYETK